MSYVNLALRTQMLLAEAGSVCCPAEAMGGCINGQTLMASLSRCSIGMLVLAQSRCSRAVLNGCDIRQLQACLHNAQAHDIHHTIEIARDNFLDAVCSAQVPAPDAAVTGCMSYARQKHVNGNALRLRHQSSIRSSVGSSLTDAVITCSPVSAWSLLSSDASG